MFTLVDGLYSNSLLTFEYINWEWNEDGSLVILLLFISKHLHIVLVTVSDYVRAG
jgi:hypothetical protein